MNLIDKLTGKSIEKDIDESSEKRVVEDHAKRNSKRDAERSETHSAKHSGKHKTSRGEDHSTSRNASRNTSSSGKRAKLMVDITICILVLLVFHFQLLSYVEFKLEDYLYQQPQPLSPDIVLLGIDEEALAMFGRADQWSRNIMAEAIDVLNGDEDYKPAVIAIDVIYAGESNDADADRNLAAAAERGGNVVVASNAIFGDVLTNAKGQPFVKAVINYETPYPALAEQTSFGFVSPIIDNDGVIRNAPLFYRYGEDTIYSFPVEIAKEFDRQIAKYDGIFDEDYDGIFDEDYNNTSDVEYGGHIDEDYDDFADAEYGGLADEDYDDFADAEYGGLADADHDDLTDVEYNGLADAEYSYLPEAGDAFLSYAGKPGDYYMGSFAEIFKEDFDPGYYADCIVIIGPYAPGLMDVYYTSTSTNTQMYGAEIHANTVQMLLVRDFKYYVPELINFLILLALVIIGTLICRLLDIRIALAVFAVMATAHPFLGSFLFKRGYIVALIYPIFALAFIYIYHLIYGYILETLEKRKIKDAFKKYVDPKLVDKLVESGEANSNEAGILKDIAVLFVDVRGFTPMTEALKDQPDMVVKILNEYLELTSRSVFDNGGSVDKFIGDATMALFNGFVALDDYVFKAVKAAWDIVQGAGVVNASIKEKYNVDVGFGVGVNCGNAIVGNLGPSFRKDYTAIGDTVNTAARLESNAKRSEVLISNAVYEQVKDRVTAVSIGEIPLKGKSIKLEVFSVTGVLEALS